MSLDHERMPSACPCCGAFSLAPDHDTQALLAVADVLVVKSLESLGKFLARCPGAGRSRFHELDGRPFYVAHTLWPPDQRLLDKALRGAWDIIPAMLSVHGCCDVTPAAVTAMLDGYVRDLAITGTPHDIEELAYRFEDRLGLSVSVHAHAHA